MIAAERVVPLRGPVGLGQVVEIARMFAVIQNYLLVQIAQFVEHRPKISTKAGKRHAKKDFKATDAQAAFWPINSCE